MARYGLGGLGHSPPREVLLRRPRRRLPRTRSWTAGSGGLPATPWYRSRRVRPPTGATPRNAWPLDAFGVPVLRIRNTDRRPEGKAHSVDEETNILTRRAADDGKSSDKENVHELSLLISLRRCSPSQSPIPLRSPGRPRSKGRPGLGPPQESGQVEVLIPLIARWHGASFHREPAIRFSAGAVGSRRPSTRSQLTRCSARQGREARRAQRRYLSRRRRGRKMKRC